jgi:hypothetical protein
LFSLADRGQYAKYYATHSVWIKTSDGKNRPYHFQCIEKTNKETKMIESRCPFCDAGREAKVQYDLAKEKGVTKDQLDAYAKAHVWPFQVKKQFYVNAVSTDNTVGLLALGIKAFRALQDRLMDIRATYQGLDGTGMDGVFLNFKKTQKFKGDRDTVYTVDVAQESSNVNGQFQTVLKMHTITDKFIVYLEKSARDLGDLFKEISYEDMKAIVSASDENKAIILERLFARADKYTQETTIGGTNAVAVNTVSVGGGGITVNAPESKVAPAQTPTFQTPPTAASIAQPVAPQLVTNQAPQQAQVPVSTTISDDEFLKAFMSK